MTEFAVPIRMLLPNEAAVSLKLSQLCTLPATYVPPLPLHHPCRPLVVYSERHT